MMKKMLLDILDFYRYKLENDKCTQEDMKTVFSALSKDVVSETTTKDIAEFYGQSESNVRNVISRHLMEKPKRVVLYNFNSLLKFIPKRWNEKKRFS